MNKNYCKIVFEIGPTHSGLNSARALIDAAANSGADAVKFQMIDADSLMNNPHQEFSYGALDPEGKIVSVSESLHAILKRRELLPAEWSELISYSKSKGLQFFTTVTTLLELDFAIKSGVDSIKIASGDITFHQLIKKAAESKVLVQLDTGNADMEEIEAAIHVVRSTGNNEIVIHHCPPGYPAKDEDIYLETIEYIRNHFGVKVAFSDHSPGWHMDIAALAKGAEMIEKTLTLNKSTRSPEHMFSLLPSEAKEFVKEIRAVEAALRPGIRKIDEASKNKALNIRRSPYALRNLLPGEILTSMDVIYQRPGTGFQPFDFEEYLGRELIKPILKGEIFDEEHFKN